MSSNKIKIIKLILFFEDEMLAEFRSFVCCLIKSLLYQTEKNLRSPTFCTKKSRYITWRSKWQCDHAASEKRSVILASSFQTLFLALRWSPVLDVDGRKADAKWAPWVSLEYLDISTVNVLLVSFDARDWGIQWILRSRYPKWKIPTTWLCHSSLTTTTSIFWQSTSIISPRKL